ncbi:hypothetical protein Hanom_Chr13g01226261 [Helianthus anomalus]
MKAEAVWFGLASGRVSGSVKQGQTLGQRVSIGQHVVPVKLGSSYGSDFSHGSDLVWLGFELTGDAGQIPNMVNTGQQVRVSV